MSLSTRKKSKTDVKDELEELCIINWDTEFRVLFQSDDMGEHIVIAFEEEVPFESKHVFKSPYQGWRLVRMIVPDGYLSVFHPLCT
jgi:hypothetical protein